MPTPTENPKVRELFKMGAHFGYSRARRHPSTDKFVYGFKNRNAVLDLEKALESLEAAQTFLKEIGAKGKKIIFVSHKLLQRKDGK